MQSRSLHINLIGPIPCWTPRLGPLPHRADPLMMTPMSVCRKLKQEWDPLVKQISVRAAPNQDHPSTIYPLRRHHTLRPCTSKCTTMLGITRNSEGVVAMRRRILPLPVRTRLGGRQNGVTSTCKRAMTDMRTPPGITRIHREVIDVRVSITFSCPFSRLKDNNHTLWPLRQKGYQ